MKIVTYNLRFGGSGKKHWSKIIEDFDPDLFLVQESYPPDDHLPPMLFPGLSAGAVWQVVGGQKWGSGIWVKQGKIKQIGPFDFPGNVVGAEVAGFPLTSGGNFLAFSVHAPFQKSYRRRSMRSWMRLPSCAQDATW